MRDERQDDAIDALIANAAKALTAGEPTRSLRSGVRERIARRRTAWPLVPAWGLAVAAMILVVVVGRSVMRPAEDGRVAPSAQQIVESGPSAVPEAPPLATQVPAPQTVESTAVVRRRAMAELLPDEEDPLIPPLTIAPLSTTQIAVGMSPGVMPIEIEPLQIEPLQGAGQ